MDGGEALRIIALVDAEAHWLLRSTGPSSRAHVETLCDALVRLTLNQNAPQNETLIQCRQHW